MDNIEPRIHDEIKDYKEKFYNFTIRQWLFAILIVIVVVPTYLLLTPIVGSELSGWIVIFLSIPIGFFGFIPIQGLNAEKMIFFWKRNYINFSKPVLYKTEEEIMQSKRKWDKTKKLTKEEKEFIKRKLKEEKKKKKELKIKRNKQRDIAINKKKFEISNNKNKEILLSEEEARVLLKFVQQAIGGKEDNIEKQEENKTEETQEFLE